MTEISLEQEVENLFRLGKHIDFQDGFNNDFSRELEALVGKHGVAAVELISGLVDKTKGEVPSRALQYLGGIFDEVTHNARFDTLVKGLSHESYDVRDGAALGLDLLDDTRAIRYLEEAIEREPMVMLKKNLQQVLDAFTGSTN